MADVTQEEHTKTSAQFNCQNRIKKAAYCGPSMCMCVRVTSLLSSMSFKGQPTVLSPM